MSIRRCERWASPTRSSRLAKPENQARRLPSDASRAGLATPGGIGYLGEDGYLHLNDRQSHMIVGGCVNLYPLEAEIVLSTHPRVADVAVIGVPDSDLAEVAKAAVEPVGPLDDAEALAADLLDHCLARIGPVKSHRSVDFVASLPRSEAGKLLKRVLREPYWRGHAIMIW